MNEFNHYTDDDFQNYLDHIFEGDVKTFESHLHECVHCNENFQAYSVIWSLVNTELKTDSLKIDLASTVIQRVMPDQPIKPVAEKVIYGLYFLLGCACLVSCILYLVSQALPVSFVLLIIPLILYFMLTYKEMKLLSGKFAL